MKLALTLFIAGGLLSACGEVKAPEAPAPAPATTGSDAKPAKKGGTDYKAMFGPDYKRGDIGHSTGTLIDKDDSADHVTIEHGVIHGIDRGANRTKFESLDTADLSAISPGAKVEFLVKKGPDNIYRLFSICEMVETGQSCL